MPRQRSGILIRISPAVKNWMQSIGGLQTHFRLLHRLAITASLRSGTTPPSNKKTLGQAQGSLDELGFE
jgi:hypothetical protein